MVVLVVGNAVGAIAVLGLDEQRAGGKRVVWFDAVLGSDDGATDAADTLIIVECDVLGGFGDESFVGVQEVGALGGSECRAADAAVLFFPESAVQQVIAIAGNELVVVVFHSNQLVLYVVAVERDGAAVVLFNRVAIGIVVVANNAACATIAIAAL
jgi:hypothetical protein